LIPPELSTMAVAGPAINIVGGNPVAVGSADVI
jgi:hypothetical protein